MSFCTGSCWKDSQISNGQEPLLHSVSQHCCKAGPVLGCVWRAPGPFLSLADSKLELRGSPVLAAPTYRHSPHGYLAPACYEELFQLPVGPVLVTAGQTPGCQGEDSVLWGLSQAPLHPRPLQSCGISVRTALGMAALEKSNAGRAVTAPAVPHTGSNPASLS